MEHCKQSSFEIIKIDDEYFNGIIKLFSLTRCICTGILLFKGSQILNSFNDQGLPNSSRLIY